MNDLMMLAYYHGYGYGGGWSNWIAHVVISSVIHALVYGTVFKLMHQLTLGEAVVLAVVVIGCIVMWGRSRDRRGW